MEKYKLWIEILKIKLLFFSALVGGSFGYFLNIKNFYNEIILIFLMFIGVIGVIKILYELGILYKKLKDEE